MCAAALTAFTVQTLLTNLGQVTSYLLAVVWFMLGFSKGCCCSFSTTDMVVNDGYP